MLEINRETRARFYFDALMSPQGKEAYAYLIRRGRDRKTIRHFRPGVLAQRVGRADPPLKIQKASPEEEMLEANVAMRGRAGASRIDPLSQPGDVPSHHRPAGATSSPLVGRALEGDDGGKSTSTPATPSPLKKSRNLFALNFAKVSKRPGLILAEGYMDVIALHPSGV